MNITVLSLASSMAMPVLLGMLLFWCVHRGRLIPFAMIFVCGGLASFLLALGFSRSLMPFEEFAAGPPGSVRAGLASAFLAAALPEELARILIALCLIAAARNVAGRNIVLTCGMIGLGFAMFENLLYSLSSTPGPAIVIERAIPTLSHGATSLIMGSFLERAFLSGRRLRPGFLLLAALVPCLLHGFHNFGAFILETSEFPDLPDDPSLADLKALGAILPAMLLLFTLGLAELTWAARIVYAVRMESKDRCGLLDGSINTTS